MTDPGSLPFAPVAIETPTADVVRIVSSVREATEALAWGWPSEGRGLAYSAALADCYAALSGRIDTKLARLSFVRAAMEVGILISDEASRKSTKP